MLHNTAVVPRLCVSTLASSSTLLASTPVFNHVQSRSAGHNRGSRKREKKRVKKRLGYSSYSKTGEQTVSREEEMRNKKMLQRQKMQEEDESKQVFKIPEGNVKKGVDFSSPSTLRQGLQEMLNAPVQQPLGRKVDLKSSAKLGLPPKIEYETKQKTEKKTQRRDDDDDESGNPLTEEQEAEMKKMVFSDRKDYINYQIHVLKEKVKHKEKISAHRFTQLFKEKTLTESEAKSIFDVAREAEIKEPVLYNAYISYFARNEKPERAITVLEFMQKDKVKPNLITWNILMDLFCKVGQHHEAVRIFDNLHQRHIKPDIYTFSILIKHFARAKQPDVALDFYERMKFLEVRPDIVIHNAIIKMHVDTNQYAKAKEIFDRLRIAARVLKQKNPERAILPDRITYSILISKLVKDAKFGDARDLLDEMKNEGFKPDAELYSGIISELGKAGKVESVMDAYDEMLEDGIEPNLNVYNALIDAYKQNDLPEKAEAVMQEIAKKKLKTPSTSYSALIEGFLKQADVRQGIEMIKQMKQNRVQPSENVYTSLFNIIPLSILSSSSSDSSSSSPSSSSSSLSVSSLSEEQRNLFNKYAYEIFQLMKEDKRYPYAIYENLINSNISKNSENSEKVSEEEFRFFFEIFDSHAYRPDSFFVDSFVEVLAVKSGKCKTALRFLTFLVDRATSTGEKLYTSGTFEIVVRGFTLTEDFENVLNTFKLWARSGVRVEETTCVPALVKLILAGKKEAASVIVQIAQSCGANGKIVLEGLDEILAPTTHKERAEKEREWLIKNMHPGQTHVRAMYMLHQEQKSAAKMQRLTERQKLQMKHTPKFDDNNNEIEDEGEQNTEVQDNREREIEIEDEEETDVFGRNRETKEMKEIRERMEGERKVPTKLIRQNNSFMKPKMGERQKKETEETEEEEEEEFEELKEDSFEWYKKQKKSSKNKN